MAYKLLLINPGSTSTKIAVFNNDEKVFEKTLSHSTEELRGFTRVFDQFEFRKQIILDTLRENRFDIHTLHAVVGRGGVLSPIPGGTYGVSEKMLSDLRTAIRGEHASNLGAVIARDIAAELSIPSFIVDPVVVDELQPVARLTGLDGYERESKFHALNQKAVARRAAAEVGRKYEDINVIVAHLGGGISVGAHEKGKIIDVNDALYGDAPFSPERAGAMPTDAIINMCFTEKLTMAEIKQKLAGKGGLISYLGTNDVRDVLARIKVGDEKAELVYNAMAYQVSKAIGSCGAVLKGNVDAVLITGGIAYDANFVQLISDRISYLAPVKVYPGEDEMKALAEGALRVLKGEEELKVY